MLLFFIKGVINRHVAVINKFKNRYFCLTVNVFRLKIFNRKTLQEHSLLNQIEQP